MQLLQCPSIERLRAGLEGSHEGPALAAHVESCRECQSQLEHLAAGAEHLDSWLLEAGGTSVVPPDPAMLAAMARLSIEPWSPTGPRPTPGMRVGEYRLEEPLGEGGMGAVWRAVHTRLEKTVALKLLNRRLSRQPDAVERFAREMKAVGRLGHPNIVLAMDANEWEGTPYLVMEHVEGIDLGRLVKEGGPLEVANACEVARQAAIGLQHSHEQGLVHRDVKPGNLMLASDGTVKLLDLGLARLIGLAEELPATGDAATVCATSDLTGTDMLVGTTGYMAPEQRRDPRTVDARADVYALGRTLCFLLTGSPSLTEAGAVSSGLLKVLQRLQAEQPADRYPTAAAASQAIRPWCRGSDLGALVGIKRPKTQKRNRILLAATALVIVGIGVGVGVYLSIPEAEQVVPGVEPAPGPPPVAKKDPPKAGELGMTAEDAANLQKQWADHLEQTPTIENTMGMKLALIPPGELNLSLATRVKITKPYWLGTTEVTLAQFRKFVDATGHRTEVEANGSGHYQMFVATGKYDGGTRSRKDAKCTWRTPGFTPVPDDDPVTQVSWNDAVAFCRWRSREESKTYRLPTAAESQWAARAGEPGYYPGNHPDGELARSLDLFAWTFTTSPQRPRPVAGLRANAWGLFDMLGNVSEWAQDWWGEPAPGAHSDYWGPAEGKMRVICGGAYTTRPTFDSRAALGPDWGMSSIGFRVLRE